MNHKKRVSVVQAKALLLFAERSCTVYGYRNTWYSRRWCNQRTLNTLLRRKEVVIKQINATPAHDRWVNSKLVRVTKTGVVQVTDNSLISRVRLNQLREEIESTQIVRIQAPAREAYSHLINMMAHGKVLTALSEVYPYRDNVRSWVKEPLPTFEDLEGEQAEIQREFRRFTELYTAAQEALKEYVGPTDEECMAYYVSKQLDSDA